MMANAMLLDEALECAVCLEVLSSENRVLPCQHTFCRSCLIHVKQSNKGLLQCPECRLEITTEIDDLPSNIILKRILDNLVGINLTPKKINKLPSVLPTLSSPSCSYTDSQSSNITQTPQSLLGTPSSSQKYGSLKIVPCTVEQVLRMINGLYHDGTIEISNKILLIGKITNVQVKSCVEYDIDDGTAAVPLTVKSFEDNLMYCNIGSYVKVYGKITSSSKEFLSVNIQPVIDTNELTTHMLEIVHNSIVNSKRESKLKYQDDEEFLLSDSSFDNASVEESDAKKNVKRKLTLDLPSNKEIMAEQVTPIKKRRRRIKVFEDSSSETSSDDDGDLPPLTSTERKGKKRVNISDDEIILDDNSNDSSSATEPLDEDDVKFIFENDNSGHRFSTPKNPPQVSDRRSSDRIKKKQKRKFKMPCRKEVFNSIDSSVSEESLDELKGRKPVNDLTKVTNRYNYDPNYYTSDECDSFIDDDFEYLDEDSYVTEDSNYNSDDKNKSSKQKPYKNKLHKRSFKKGKSKPPTDMKGKSHRKKIHDSSSDFVIGSDTDSYTSESEATGKTIKKKKSKKSSRCLKPVTNTSSEDSLYSECSSEEIAMESSRGNSSSKKLKNARKIQKGKKNDNFDEDIADMKVGKKEKVGKKKKNLKQPVTCSEEDSVDSDIGELSKSILSKVSERSRTMSERKIKKQGVFDELKQKRAEKLERK